MRKGFDEALDLYSTIYKFAFSYTEDEHDAKDLTQETYRKALRSWETYENGTNLKAWLTRIAKNTFINKVRKKKVKTKDLPDTKKTPFRNKGEFKQPHHREGQILSGRMKAAIKSLQPKYRRVVVLVLLSDMEYKEAAYILDCPVGTIMSRLHRARNKLKEKLGGKAIREGIIREVPEKLHDV